MSKCIYFDVEKYKKEHPENSAMNYKPCNEICPRYNEPCKRWRLCIIGISAYKDTKGENRNNE